MAHLNAITSVATHSTGQINPLDRNNALAKAVPTWSVLFFTSKIYSCYEIWHDNKSASLIKLYTGPFSREGEELHFTGFFSTKVK